jgi:hypothetical protein
MRKYRPRIYYTEADKALMWDRYRVGKQTSGGYAGFLVCACWCLGPLTFFVKPQRLLFAVENHSDSHHSHHL